MLEYARYFAVLFGCVFLWFVWPPLSLVFALVVGGWLTFRRAP